MRMFKEDLDMMVPESVIVDGEEYVWDGHVFPDEGEARAEARKYLRHGFKVQMKNENGDFYLYKKRALSCKRCSLRART